MNVSEITEPVTVPGYKFIHKIPDVLVDARDPLFDLVDDPKLIVEVGSQWGWFALRAATQTQAKIFCIDPWGSIPTYRCGSGKPVEVKGLFTQDDLLEWSNNLGSLIGSRVTGLHGTSMLWADRFGNESIDLCLIDGDHRSESVRDDCNAWWPKLRPGGLMVGDDMNGRWAPHVKAGVEMAFGKDYEVDFLFLRAFPHRKDAKTRLAKCWYRRK